MADEKVDVKEFAKGYVKPSSWWKAFGICSKFLIILFIGYCIYRVLFPKPTQQQTIIAKPGSTINVQQKQETKRRTLIPFMEAFVEQSRNVRMNTGVRIGVRVEW